MSELKLPKLSKELENLPIVTKITIAKSSTGRWFLCFSLGDVFTYNFPLKTSEKGRQTIADMLNAEIKETNVKFVRMFDVPDSSFDRFNLYQKEGKVICALFAIDSDAFSEDIYGYQFSFEISRPDLIPKSSMKQSHILFHKDFN